MALTQKRKIFIEHYAVTGNGTESAVKAGYSKRSAPAISTELLGIPEVSELIKKKREEITAKIDVTKDDIIRGVLNIADKEDAKDSDKVQAYKLLAQITGNLRESTTNVAIFSNMESVDGDIVSRRLGARVAPGSNTSNTSNTSTKANVQSGNDNANVQSGDDINVQSEPLGDNVQSGNEWAKVE